MFTVAPTASPPYSTEAGPFSTSSRSTFASCVFTRLPSLRIPSSICTESLKPRNV